MEYIRVNKITKQGNIFTGENWLELHDIEVIDERGKVKRKAKVTDALISHIQLQGFILISQPQAVLKDRLLKEHPDIKNWFEQLQLI